jgi:hypothetical protein
MVDNVSPWTKANVYYPLPYNSLVPAGNQHYHHNEDNMSNACLHNYERLVNA